MKKNKFEKSILSDAEKLKVPSGLEPDEMIKKISNSKKQKKESSVNEGAIADRYIDVGKKQIRRFHKNVVKACAVAACLMLCAVGLNNMLSKEITREIKGERADNYRQIYNKLCEIQATYNAANNTFSGGFWDQFFSSNSYREEVVFDDAINSVTGEVSKGEAVSGSQEYSDTNVRTEGVDEGDVIKTDGSYIYCLERNHTDQIIYGCTPKYKSLIFNELDANAIQVDYEATDDKLEETTEIETETESETESEIETESETESETETELETEVAPEPEKERDANADYVKIIKADGKGSYVISEINISEKVPEGATSYTFKEMYVSDDTLFVVCEQSFANKDAKVNDDFYDMTSQEYMTVVYSYDIKNKKDIKYIGKVAQEGLYMTSRLTDGYVYTFTYKTLYDFTEERCVPKVNNNYILPQNIYISEYVDKTSYIVVSSFETKKPKKIKKSFALLADYADFYVSGSGIYVLENSYEEEEKDDLYSTYVATHITKINYNKGKISVGAEKSFHGSIPNSDCIDEYNGNLRVVFSLDETTSEKNVDYYEFVESNRTNSVVILNSKLEETGRLDGIANNEDLKSAKFLGNTVYFVTFLNTDPLFAVDLSDASQPKVLGELIVDGYSEYLYKWDDTHLLGIGRDADPRTGAVTGAKLSMFDVSDPLNMVEVSRYVVEGDYSYFNTDYKSLLLEPEKNLIGISLYKENYSSSDDYGYNYSYSYEVLSYDAANGFTRNISDEFVNSDVSYGIYNVGVFHDVRGIYINDNLYILVPKYGIRVCDLNTYNTICQFNYDVTGEAMVEPVVEPVTEEKSDK